MRMRPETQTALRRLTPAEDTEAARLTRVYESI